MSLKLLFVFIFYLFISNLYANEVVIMFGYADRFSFEKSAAHAYNIATKNGWNAKVYQGKLEHWKTWTRIPKKDLIIIAEVGRSAFLLDVKNKAKKLKKEEDLILYIDGHGGTQLDDGDPLTARTHFIEKIKWKQQRLIKQFNQTTSKIEQAKINIQLAQIGGKLEKNPFTHKLFIGPLSHVPLESYGKFIACHCNDGGLHSVSFTNPRTCSITGTHYNWSYYFNEDVNDGRALFSEGVWTEIGRKTKKFDINGDGKSSLFEAYLSGVANDYENKLHGQISSDAYIDSILHSGAYEDTPKKAAELSLIDIVKQTDPQMLKPDISLPIYASRGCYEAPIAKEITKFGTEVSGYLKEEVKKQNYSICDQPICKKKDVAPLFNSLERLWSKTRKEWADEKKKVLPIVSKMNKELDDITTEWNRLLPNEQTKRKSEFEKKTDKLNQKAKEYSLNISFPYRIMRMMRKMQKIFKSGTIEQKKKIIELLKCEMDQI